MGESNLKFALLSMMTPILSACADSSTNILWNPAFLYVFCTLGHFLAIYLHFWHLIKTFWKKILYHMSQVTCDMWHVTCHMSHVTYHMSHVTCHFPLVTNANNQRPFPFPTIHSRLVPDQNTPELIMENLIKFTNLYI